MCHSDNNPHAETISQCCLEIGYIEEKINAGKATAVDYLNLSTIKKRQRDAYQQYTSSDAPPPDKNT